MTRVEVLAQRLWQVHAHSFPREPGPFELLRPDGSKKVIGDDWNSLDEDAPDEKTVSRNMFREWAVEILRELDNTK